MAALRDVFFIAFLTFLLSYLVRSVVVAVATRVGPAGERPGLERWLTLATFALLVALIWVSASLLGPRFVAQGRLLMTDAQRLDPRETMEHVLSRTVGAYLFRQTYGDPADSRFAAGQRQFEADGRFGEGAFAAFGRLEFRVQAEFEIAYAGADAWRQFQATPAYVEAFRDWYRRRAGQPDPLPYDLETYRALRDAYAQGLAAFSAVYSARLGATAAGQALLQPDGSLALALYALLGIAVIHAIEATILSSRIVGRVLHLHPVLVMVILIIGEHLAGIWGLLLGVPLSVYIIHALILAEPIPGVYEPPLHTESEP